MLLSSRLSSATWLKNWVPGSILHVRLGCRNFTEDTNLIIGRLAVFHIWAVSENYIVIVGASIPTLSPLWRRGKQNTSDLRGYEMYGNNDSKGRNISIVGQGRSTSNVQKTVANTDSTSPGHSNTSQEHILESEIVRTIVVDVSYSDHGKLDTV